MQKQPRASERGPPSGDGSYDKNGNALAIAAPARSGSIRRPSS
ncbi:hypothetical protein RRSWK_04842 [Rhodopirellula sp. SWK7]|nr:hypothetical protein RRSWK_04842 [Rhodopirellula sp. SWK7]